MANPRIRLISKRQAKVGFDKQPAYVTRAWRYSTLSRDKIIEMIASDSGVNEAIISACFNAMVHQMEQMLLNGHSVEMYPLGIFRLSIKAKAVANKENISANLIRSVKLLFRPSTRLKAEMRRVQFDVTIEDETA